MRKATKVYSWLLKLYPARFREEYAPVLERQFRDEYRDVAGLGDAIRLWGNTLWDMATSVPSQSLSEMSMDIRQGTRALPPAVSQHDFGAGCVGAGDRCEHRCF